MGVKAIGQAKASKRMLAKPVGHAKACKRMGVKAAMREKARDTGQLKPNSFCSHSKRVKKIKCNVYVRKFYKVKYKS